MSILLLVRHGQASFGKRNYDALSERGHEQSRILGAALAARRVTPARIVTGGMRRHAETAEGILEGLGRTPELVVDDGWDEFNFEHVMQVHRPLYKSRTLMFADFVRTPRADRRAKFQGLFEEATSRWTGGTADDDYDESFPAFFERVDGALRRTAEDQDAAGGGTVLVVSSGGPIGLVASSLLAGDASLWVPLNRVAVNTAVTKVVTGRSGLTLSTYNEHSHLEHDRELVTYR